MENINKIVMFIGNRLSCVQPLAVGNLFCLKFSVKPPESRDDSSAAVDGSVGDRRVTVQPLGLSYPNNGLKATSLPAVLSDLQT